MHGDPGSLARQLGQPVVDRLTATSSPFSPLPISKTSGGNREHPLAHAILNTCQTGTESLMAGSLDSRHGNDYPRWYGGVADLRR